MYTANFIANSDYLINHLLKQRVLQDELNSTKLVYDIVDDAVSKKQIISENPRIVAQTKNIGQFSLEQMLPMLDNISLPRRPRSINCTDALHTNTKQEYICNRPTNFMIIAKPGNRTFKLAQKMEEEFKCVHIDCNEIVKQEVQSKSRLGIWLDKNLQLNKILPIEIILWLVQRETRTSKIAYRGYILTGLPIIPDMNLNVQKNSLTEEDFLALQQIIDEIIDVPYKLRAHELENLKKKLFSEYDNLDEDVVELTKDITEQSKFSEEFRPVPKLLHRITCDQDVRFSIQRQLYFALDLENQPTLVIYIDCDDEDIITKNRIFQKSTPDELESIRVALRRYNNALDIIQEFLCHIPRPNLIYCQGIYNPDDTFKTCRGNVLECNIRRVFLADDFYSTFKDNDTIIEKLDATLDPNDVLDILRGINPLRGNFVWFRSSFETKCPVMMTQGKVATGKYQHSVRFTGCIYMCSSNECQNLFIENPQFYIQPQPSCRVAIMGPRCSGKSTFARCLAKFFDNSIIIDVQYLFDYYKKIDIRNCYYAECCERAMSLLNMSILDSNNEEEKIRQGKIDGWIKVMKQNIIAFLKPIPKIKGKNKKQVPDKKAVHAKELLKDVLDEFGFETDNPVLLKAYLMSNDLFLNKLPLGFRREVILRNRQVSDTDVQKLAQEYMNEVSKDYVVPFARKLEILVTKIRLCEKRQKILTKQNKLYGYWILDGLPPDLELIKGLQEMSCLPDVIVHMDDSVGERLAEIQNIKCRREFYDINYVVGTISATNKRFFKHLINKYPLKNSEHGKLFLPQLVRRELDHILQQESLQGIKDFHEENGKYREDFEQIKSFFEPNLDIHFVGVDIHGTSWTQAIIIGLKYYMNFFNAHPHILKNDSSADEVQTSSKVLRVGSTAEYCPVLFVDKMLLKLGLAKYAVQLKNRTYLMSTEAAQQTFVNNPFRYSELERPFQIPPYRLCVIGNYHTTKRSDLRRVADILGTKHLSIDNTINLYLGKLTPKRILDISTYYEILDELGDKLVKELFAPLFQDGFLFEGFPVTAEHLKQMIALHHCPEQIFYLKIENKHLMNDELAFYMKQYKDVLVNKIDALQLQNKDWITQRKLRFVELFDELQQNAPIEEGEEELSTDRLELETVSAILNVFDVVPNSNRAVQMKQLNVADMVNEEMPPDMYTKQIDELEKFPVKREVKKFIRDRTEEFEKIKMVAEDHLIPFIQIRLHPYTTKEIEKSLLKHIKEGTDRQYIFERAFPISYESAMDYLDQGQFLLSRYYWTCPVKNLDMDYPVKLTRYTPDLDKLVQPFVYLSHIYFVQRVHHNVNAFLARPYLYTSRINQCHITNPMHLVVHGPQNAGCHTLCNRIAKEFQLNHFTLDSMMNSLVKKFKWTKLAKALIDQKMKILDNQQICDLIKVSINFETQGWVLLGVPFDDELVNCFMINGLDINLIIYLNPTGVDLWTNIKNKYNTEKNKRKLDVLHNLYNMVSQLDNFSDHSTRFRGLNRNIISIDDFTSRWKTWYKAFGEIVLLLRLHNLYELRGIDLVAGSLYKLDVTDTEITYRLSPLKLYCPLCWHLNKSLVKYRYHYADDRDAPPLYSNNLYDKNLFQFRKHFYWSCNTHLFELMVNSDSYLMENEETLPEELPKLVKEWDEDIPVTNDGYCAVAYYESGENDIILGLKEYSVLYYNKIYVMSSRAHCISFLQNPEKYRNVNIVLIFSRESTVDDDLLDMKLDLGSITPTLITNALLECAFSRPKHFNLEPGQSLEIYLGLYFKCHNTNSTNNEIEAYKSMFLKYWDDCKLVQRKINEMQMSGNPFINNSKKNRKETSVRGSSTSAFGF